MIWDFFKNTKQEIVKLNSEYENMSKINKVNSTEIRKSIAQKSTELTNKKQERKRHFNFIHNK